MVGGGSLSQKSRFDIRSTQARTGTSTSMTNRLTTAQFAAMRRFGPFAALTVATMAALAALTADAAARQARPAPPKEAAAPRDAGEPIMAIVSIKTQQVTVYDADGWI